MAMVARWVMYGLLGMVGVGVAGVVYAIFGVAGYYLGIMLLSLLNLLVPQSEELYSICGTCGALLGGGCGLAGLALIWLSEAQRSHDPRIRRRANELDELRRAMWKRH